MLTTIIAFCWAFNPGAPTVQGYQPIVRSVGVESRPTGDLAFSGPQPRALWYSQSTYRVDLRLGSAGQGPLPVEVTLKFETPSPIVGIHQRDVVRKVLVKDPDALVKVYYTTTTVPDNLTLAIYIGETKRATLPVGILKGVAGAGTLGR